MWFVHLTELCTAISVTGVHRDASHAPALFRLTRDAEVEMERRCRSGSAGAGAASASASGGMSRPSGWSSARAQSRGLREMLQDRFALTADDVYDLPGALDATSLFEIADLPVPALRDTPWTPVTPPVLAANVLPFRGGCRRGPARPSPLRQLR